MIEMLLLLVLNSLVCFGIYNTTVYEEEKSTYYKNGIKYARNIYNKGILWFVPYYLNDAKWYIKKPLYDCMPCMASLHSTYVYFWYYDFTIGTILFYPIYIFALAGLNSIVNDINN